jgi:hypothetical protein
VLAQALNTLATSHNPKELLDTIPTSDLQKVHRILTAYIGASNALSDTEATIIDSFLMCIALKIQSGEHTRNKHFWIKGSHLMFRLPLIYPFWEAQCFQNSQAAAYRTELIKMLRKVPYCITTGKLVSINGSNQYVAILDLDHALATTAVQLIKHSLTGFQYNVDEDV